MSWKLTIDVIFNSFPLIKNKNLILFLCHCERNEAIQWLQPRHCEQSEAIQRLQSRHCEQSEAIQWFQIPSLRAKWSNPVASISSLRAKRGNPATSNLLLRTKWSNPMTSNRHCERSNDFKGAVEKKSRESKVSRGLWTFWCKDWWCCGVNGLFNASIGSF